MVQLGKRYVDDEREIEVLCAKPGVGPLEHAGRRLTVRGAAALATSD
jgi:hypothetical protein